MKDYILWFGTGKDFLVRSSENLIDLFRDGQLPRVLYTTFVNFPDYPVAIKTEIIVAIHEQLPWRTLG
jgi:hypothetical protein